MPPLDSKRKSQIVTRTIKNLIFGKPITVSFEVTYNCNARCEHCDLGDYVKEPRLGPEVFAGWLERLSPAVAQISGGEPMLRKDIFDIISEMRRRDPLAVFVITTNSTLLNEEKYLKLREAGIDQFSLSLDYPDERHNDFRHLKGNFEHIRELVSKIVRYGNKDIILACVVQSDNMYDLVNMARLAKEWGVAINFSTYNALRTDKQYFLINTEEGLKDLEKIIDELVAMQNDGYPVLTSEWTMRQMTEFFRNGFHSDCRAGERFMIVNPWGKLTPCGMCREMYDSPEELKRKFLNSNTCEKCFTAIRANSEKSASRLLRDAYRAVRRK